MGSGANRSLQVLVIVVAAGLWALALAGSAAAAATHTVCASGCDFTTIQAAIDDAGTADGDTIAVGPGTYTENVNVTKELTITGAGAGLTVVEPATYAPTCAAGGSGSLCAGGPLPSVVFLVAASNVTISDLTVNGDNPALGGPNGPYGARDGIQTNQLAGVFNGLTVQDTTVRNIYLRGIYASSGGTFAFDANKVQNVRSDPNGASIAMFNSGGSGSMTNNDVSFAGDAISSNHSRGVTMTNNTVSHSGSGLHTDNSGDGGGTPDLIAGNTVSSCDLDGYGIFVFVPYNPPTVRDNTISGCAVGLGAFGGAFGPSPTVTPVLRGNSVDGTGASVSSGGSVGALLTTDTLGFGQTDNSVDLTANTIRNFATGVQTVELGGKSLTVAAHFNRFSANGDGLDGGTGTASDFENNWWGCNGGPNAAGCDKATGAYDANPWLVLGFSATPGSIPVGGQTAQLSATLTANSDGQNVGAGFPDGTPIAFQTDLGSVTPSSAPTTGGVAAATLTSGSNSGTAHPSATLDAQTVSDPVAFTKPSNAFSIVGVRHHRRKGTATLRVLVPGPGSLVLHGKRIVRATLQAGAAGTYRLVARAKGRALRVLRRHGKVGVRAHVTYTPTLGSPSSKLKKLKLVKKG